VRDVLDEYHGGAGQMPRRPKNSSHKGDRDTFGLDALASRLPRWAQYVLCCHLSLVVNERCVPGSRE
jgi:hypothetical protein